MNFHDVMADTGCVGERPMQLRGSESESQTLDPTVKLLVLLLARLAQQTRALPATPETASNQTLTTTLMLLRHAGSTGLP